MSTLLKKLFTQTTENEPKSGKKVNHVVVEIEITEHEYMALDSDDEMVGSESFVFNGDDSPGFIRVTVDGNEIEFDEDDLKDRCKFSDYEPFDMEEKWDSEDIVKFGYYDNLAGKTWEFDVEDFDIEKLSFYYQCFDVKFGPADYDSEEHRITLCYDGEEIQEDFDAYICDYGEFEQEWCLYDEEDDEECCYCEEEEEGESSESDRERVSRIFAILSYAIVDVDNDVAQDEISAILGTAKSMDLDCDIVRQRIVMEAKGERDYDSQSALAETVPEGAREPIFNALVRIALSDFKLSQNELAFLGSISEIWNMDEEFVNAILNYHIEMFSKVNPDRTLEIEEDSDENKDISLNDTDALWAAVISRLPIELQTNVSAPAGKSYFHIKPQDKVLGIKDFKYCVVYSSRSSEACVNVESLNGGEEAKNTIQQFIDARGENILSNVEAQQGVKNKNKWSWAVTTHANEFNEELVQWYVDTINAFYELFETQLRGVSEVSVDTDEGEHFTLIDKLCDSFIVETDDEVYYDAENADDDEKERFINNIKAQMVEEEVEVFESLIWKSAEEFTEYLDNAPDEFNLAQMIVAAAYCTRNYIEIDEDTSLYEDEQQYYFNDCMDFHYEIEIDIDLG